MAGDTSEMRGIIVTATFLCIFVFIVGFMVSESSEMFIGTNQGSSPNLQRQGPMEALAWDSGVSQTLGAPGWYTDNTIGGWNIRFYTINIIILGEQWIQLDTFDVGFLNWWQSNFEHLRWYSDPALSLRVDSDYTYFDPALGWITYIGLNMTYLDAQYALYGNQTYYLGNSRTKMTTYFSFDGGTYATPSAALAASALDMNFNIDFADRNTSINVLALIGQIMTGSLPGLDPILSAMIDIPIFICIAYLTFTFILRIIHG